MHRIDSQDSDHLEYVNGSVRRTLFGLLPFVLGSVGVFEIIRATATGLDGQSGGWFIALCVAALFAAFGAWAIVGRRHIRFDRNAKTVTTWRSAIVAFKPTAYAWSKFRSVNISREAFGAGSNSRTAYVVRLTGERVLEITASRTAEHARRIGEAIARFVGVSLADASGGDVAVREPGKLDESLRDRMRREGASLEIGPEPPAMRARVERRTGMVRVAFPGEPVSVASFAASLVIVLMVAYVVVRIGPPLWVPLRHNRRLALFAGGFVMLFFWPVFISAARFVRGVSRRISVEADAASLRVTTRGLAWRSTHTIPVADLEGLRLEHDLAHTWIAAISDRTMVHFGRGLRREELEWLRLALVHAVAAKNPFE